MFLYKSLSKSLQKISDWGNQNQETFKSKTQAHSLFNEMKSSRNPFFVCITKTPFEIF